MEPGAVVGGRYRLDAIIGEGGMGTVWAATHTITLKPVALKFLRGESADPTLRQRFLREARAACAVRHPNVAEIHDVFETDDGTPLMVMDLLEGETLASRLDRDKTLPLAEAARIMMQVTSAVGTAHHLGIVHRDLKPDNIFLARVGEAATSVKILDFGIAKLTATDGIAAITSELTTDGSMLGTPYYMSPEQADGEKDIDHRSDIWALGIILYECLSGTLPTEGENLGQVLKSITRGTFPPLSERAPDVPADISDMVGRMITRDRSLRPQTLLDVCDVLLAYTDEPLTPFSEPAPPGRSSLLVPSDGRAARPTPLHVTPATRAPAPVSPLALSLGERQTVAAGTQTLAASAQSLPPDLARRKSKLWVPVLGVAIAALGSPASFAWRTAYDVAPPAARAVTSVEAPSPASPTEKVPSATPSTSTTRAIEAGPPAVASSTAEPAAASSEVHAPRPKASRAPHEPSPRPSAAPSATQRPGGVFEQTPF